jgi:hypothetical protein
MAMLWFDGRNLTDRRSMSDVLTALIEDLAVPHRARAAFWRLLAKGPAALPTVRAALRHPSALARKYACLFLDHYVEEDALGELIAMLNDPDPQVRGSALHALACDRCKEGTCRPDEGVVLPRAIRLLESDPDAHVRAFAVGLVGQYVHRRPEAVEALRMAIASDASANVRKRARMSVPGGSLYERTKPKVPRVSRHTRPTREHELTHQRIEA